MSVKKRVGRGTKAKALRRAKRVKAKSAPRKAPRAAKRVKAPAKTSKRKPPARAKARAKTRAKTGPKTRAPAAKKKTPKATTAPVSRRDGTGHLAPRYKAELRALSREGHTKDDNRAFFSKARTDDDLAEELGEQAVETMTSGEDEGEDVLDQTVPEETGGPFIVTPAGKEFADGTDASNPENATREPFPRT